MTQRDRQPLAVSSADSGGETPLPPVLTVSEVAALLRVSDDSVYRHRRALGGFRLGRRVLFRRDRVEALTEAPGVLQGATERPTLARLTPAERKAWRDQLAGRVRSGRV